MFTEVTHLTVLVDDVEDALDWYTGTFGFEPRDDEAFAPGMRWVTVAPPGGDTEVVLQEPTAEAFGAEASADMRDRVGQGTTTVLAVDDCRATVAELADRGVTVRTQPEEVPWGVHATVEDLYGNPYNLVEER